jgi:hypothetical protein
VERKLKEKEKLKKYLIMSNLLTVDEVTNLILDCFLELGDLGFNIESCHQNGYSSYVIYDPKLIYFSLEEKCNLIEVDKDFENDMKIYLSSLSKLYDSVFYNKERIINTNGLEELNFLTKSVKLSISFRHKPQGFGNLNSKLLIGNEKMIYY